MNDVPEPTQTGGWPVRLLLGATRIVLPIIIALAGVVLIVIGQTSGGATGTHGTSATVAAAGVALIVAAIIVWMLNWMYRMSVESNQDREVEEAAREYFDRHGRWPEEPAS
jgi:mannitol-specific phosphotransferase system IIBC component